MSILTTLFGAGGDGIAKLVTAVGDQIHLSPEAKAELQQKMVENSQVMAQLEADTETKLNDIAGQNIRAETQSDDKFTKRSRPWFMYIVESILAFNYIVIPFWQLCRHTAPAPIALPDNLMLLFGTCITGYVVTRSAEKISLAPGDSQIKLPFGIQVGNKN